ncbi:hypothetical protein [Metabacillus malikii]|uniref:Membrane-bound ClpP family serine protease n=1 Tax=Metabacillus malikii TaxID=1504265 RepID=A0ABT9ZKH7_9BACI|nr:hypothetical protein [Metabacillus malikii]MDQ0232797.1 membrane-bound ClpP family serine protease [Metabacillus malikii]
MKKVPLLPSIIILSFGIFYSLQKFNIELIENQNSWQFILILLGAAFLISGHFDKDNSAILPGILLLGLGLHFLLHAGISGWPDHPAAILFILAIGLILTSLKLKKGYASGILVLITGLFLHFLQSISDSLSVVEGIVPLIETYWPFLLLLLGILFLLFRKKS